MTGQKEKRGATMRIQEVIKKTGLSRRTVYYYIDQKMISPVVDEHNGYHDFSEADIQKHLDLGKTILFRRSYTKEEVVKTAKNHLPLPPKSTRHLIPGRIIRLNMKLGWLHLSKEEARRELENMLEHRVYAGNVRKYYEPVTVIY
jgi:DNA-binding transcriptional MerR regulator